jgi:hypothetical protein
VTCVAVPPLLISNSPNLATFAPGNTFPSLERGGRITVPPAVPAKVRRDVKGVSEDDITRDLATLASQHGDAARKTLERIASRAKAMMYVPESDWEDMAFFPDEDEG